jgi:hypothetical protein
MCIGAMFYHSEFDVDDDDTHMCYHCKHNIDCAAFWHARRMNELHNLIRTCQKFDTRCDGK